MSHLFLFVTQAEGGAPGYLSALGEDAAATLAETLGEFVESLGIELEAGVERRSQQLEGLEQRESLPRPVAMRQAVEICPEVMVLSGESTRSSKTIQIFAERFAVPVVMDQRWDVSATELEAKPSLGGHLDGALAEFLRAALGSASGISAPSAPSASATSPLVVPRLIIIQTALRALGEWLPQILEADVAKAIFSSLEEASESDRVPALFVAGFEGPAPGRWIVEP